MKKSGAKRLPSLDIGNSLLDIGYSVFRIQGSGFWVLGSGFWVQLLAADLILYRLSSISVLVTIPTTP